MVSYYTLVTRVSHFISLRTAYYIDAHSTEIANCNAHLLKMKINFN